MQQLNLEHIIMRTLIEDGATVSEARKLLLDNPAPLMVVCREEGRYTLSFSPSRIELYEDTLNKIKYLYRSPTIHKLVDEALEGKRTLLDGLSAISVDEDE